MAPRQLFISNKGGRKSHPLPFTFPSSSLSAPPSSSSSSNWTMLIIITVCMITMTFLQWLQYLKPANAIHDIMNSANALSFQPSKSNTSPSNEYNQQQQLLSEHANTEIISYTTKPRFKNLLFYNRPPKTGSTSVRIAMKRALDSSNLTSAKCFNRIEWNEMAMRTIINRRNIDFYGCHTRLTDERYNELLNIRGNNITLMTSTREPSRLILSSYLQENFRNVNVSEVEQHIDIKKEQQRYLNFVNTYPIDALYAYHGGVVPLLKCPVTNDHVNELKRIVQRYEIVIDLEKPTESQAMVEIMTGLKPNFQLAENVRVQTITPLLHHLLKVNTSHRTCGNELVHKVLIQQFTLIKDRLLKNNCYDESSESYENCDRSTLQSNIVKDSSTEKVRKE